MKSEALIPTTATTAELALPRGIMSKGTWWLYFALDSFILSTCFQTFKRFTLYPTWGPGLAFVGTILLLILCTTVLVYDSYVKERSLGKVQYPIRLFEYMMARRIGFRNK